MIIALNILHAYFWNLISSMIYIVFSNKYYVIDFFCYVRDISDDCISENKFV